MNISQPVQGNEQEFATFMLDVTSFNQSFFARYSTFLPNFMSIFFLNKISSPSFWCGTVNFVK